jgi:hypothetical protein
MDILFCDRCRESIPDADLDAGRAVRVGGRLYHVPCAFRRAMPGPARVALFALALYAAAAATYALVRVLDRDAAAPDGAAPAAVARSVGDELAAFRRDVDALLARERAALADEIRAAVTASQERIAAEQAAEVSKLAAALQERLQGWTDVHLKRFESDEAKIAEIAAWVKEVRDLAGRLSTEPSPAGAGAPPATPETPPEPPPVAAEPEPAPTPGAAPLDPEAQRRHDEEVLKWIGMLKDANTPVAYSAAYKLKLLKDAKAVPALVETLKGHRDLWVRAESATALGAIRSADAVPALIEALEDKEQYVFASASDALVKVTGQEFSNFALDPSRKERKAYRDQWAKWWRENEAAVRQRLGQPLPATPAKGS